MLVLLDFLRSDAATAIRRAVDTLASYLSSHTGYYTSILEAMYAEHHYHAHRSGLGLG